MTNNMSLLFGKLFAYLNIHMSEDTANRLMEGWPGKYRGRGEIEWTVDSC